MMQPNASSWDEVREHHQVFETEMEESEQQWRRVCLRLRGELGADVFRSWFWGVSFAGIKGNRVELRVPSRFIGDWIATHCEDRLRVFWAAENNNVTRVDLVLASTGVGASGSEGPERDDPASEEAGGEAGVPRQVRNVHVHDRAVASTLLRQGNASDGLFDAEALGAPLDPHFTFDNFVVGSSNELACSAARQVADTPGNPFNPLYIYGQVGLGKTHLLHAIGWELRRKNPQAKVLYLSAERFMYRFVQALRDKDVMSFKDHFRGVDILLLDDVQFIANKKSTQEEFFHTFDSLMAHNRQVVISADRSPADLDGVGERIRSRLGQGLSVDIHATDFDLRLGILKSKLTRVVRQTRGQVDIPNGVMEFLAHRIVCNVRVLEGALTRLAAHAALVDRPVTIDMTKDILADLLRTSDRKITIDDIQRCVVKYFSLNMADLVSARRARDVARPRQIAMYLCKHMTARSLPEIGRKFGGRDHTTVIHAVRRIEKLRSEDRAIDGDVESLRRQLSGGQMAS